jgi:hypothetical protein
VVPECVAKGGLLADMPEADIAKGYPHVFPRVQLQPEEAFVVP